MFAGCAAAVEAESTQYNLKNGLTVKVGKPTILAQADDYGNTSVHFCNMVRSANGTIMAWWGNVPDSIVKGTIIDYRVNAYRISTDDGTTWSELRYLDYAVSRSCMQLPDGTWLALAYLTGYDTPRQCRLRVLRSKDAKNWTVDTEAVLRLPDTLNVGFAKIADQSEGWAPAKGKTFGGSGRAPSCLVIHGPLWQYRGGLYTTAYGKMLGDEHYRCILIRSMDGGSNWEYVSTIADSLRPRHNGFTEPDVCELANGDLLAAMRTQYSLGRILAQTRLSRPLVLLAPSCTGRPNAARPFFVASKARSCGR